MSDVLSLLRNAHREADNFRKEKNTKQYPDEFKKVVIDAYSKGITVNKMRQIIDIHPTTVYHWIQQSQQKEKDKLVPIEWIQKKKDEKAVLSLPNGIKIEIPHGVLEEVVGRILKTS